jgi:hypothetical protein
MARKSFQMSLLAAVLAAAGCGGPMKPQELARSVQTLESSAAEGALLARGVAGDRTKATFVRAHSRDLGDVVEHEAEKLADADAKGEVALRKTEAVDLADVISQALGRLQESPGVESAGRAAARELGQSAKRGARLVDAL